LKSRSEAWTRCAHEGIFTPKFVASMEKATGFAGAGGGTPTSYFEYDHWHTFYDAKVRHLAGSGCTMQ
jgi:hypothetical protein